jgi:kinesin family protein C1
MQELIQKDQEKISTLQQSHAQLQAQLVSSENAERDARRNLSTQGEEMAALRAAHAREVDELERKISRAEREKRELEDDLRRAKDDADAGRREAAELRVSGEYTWAFALGGHD